MGKPSIFSRNYEEQMRRRRINIILIVLIIVFASFFYLQYKLDKKGIKLINIKINSNKKIEQPIKNTQNQNREDKSANTQTQQNNNDKPKIETKEYVYTSPTQKIFKIKFNDENNQKKFVGVEAEGLQVDFDISQDGTKIVFDDKENQNIIVYNIDGSKQDVTIQKYVTRTSGFVFEKQKILSHKKDFIWSIKPHFTSDDKIVFLTRIPYYGSKRGLFLWYSNYNGMNFVNLGELAMTPEDIKYEGFDEKGALLINSQGKVYKLEKGSFRIK